MQQTDRVLELLYDRREGQFALDELASAAGMDLAGVQEELERLRDRGYETELSPGGVRLALPVRLDAHLIERELGTARIGKGVICFNQVGSTNDVAFDSARQADADGLVVLAESQLAGRGRLGRQWISPPRANVLMSALLIDAAGNLPAGTLTIAAGLAVAEGIESATGLGPQLVWPNDVMLTGRKVAGILVEIRSVAELRAIVIGIGINANACPDDRRIDRPATSIADQLGHDVERIELVRSVLRQLDEWVRCVSAGMVGPLHDAWVSRCDMLGRPIEVLCEAQKHVGTVIDISPTEGLILQTEGGQRMAIPAQSSTVLRTG